MASKYSNIHLNNIQNFWPKNLFPRSAGVMMASGPSGNPVTWGPVNWLHSMVTSGLHTRDGMVVFQFIKPQHEFDYTPEQFLPLWFCLCTFEKFWYWGWWYLFQVSQYYVIGRSSGGARMVSNTILESHSAHICHSWISESNYYKQGLLGFIQGQYL